MSSVYRLLDCGNQKKVEILGMDDNGKPIKVIRPCPQAMWDVEDPKLWLNPDSEFVIGGGEKGQWKNLKPDPELKRKHQGQGIPDSWEMESPDGIKWVIEANEHGNIGVFTEHWTYVADIQKKFQKNARVLNLFTYSGSNAVWLAKQGYRITAVDSSKAAMDRYTANLDNNEISRNGHKLVLEDVYKFIAREERRESQYDVIMIDAPSYGRGTKGEVFNIEDDFTKLLKTSSKLLSKNGLMVITLHSPRFTPAVLKIITQKLFPKKTVETSEIINMCESGIGLPSGFLVVVS
jgi:23S rRNA (cytosine1962-C5)-methyltransferase